jgi:hypothetical protein
VWLGSLNEAQLADLYVWLESHFPYRADQAEDENAADPGMRVADLRETVLRVLQNRGTQAACTEMERVAATLPDHPWLRWMLQETRKVTRQATWLPPAPRDLLAMAADHRKRLVRSGSELLDVVMESLARLQEKLQGVIPMGQFLWNDLGNVARPKDEDSLSDFVRNHLQDDLVGRGIVANREVQVRRPHRAGIGERTDIRVDAVSPGVGGIHDAITVVIETKGCWNRELSTAMKTQLVDRYLIDQHHRHGLYLVGWFLSDRWDPDDHRRGATPKWTVDEARDRLGKQADELSQRDHEVRGYVLDATLG